MKGKSLLAALIALGIFSGSAYAAPSFKQSGNKFTINEGADDAAVQALKGADMTKLALTLNNVKDVDLQKVCAAVPELRTLNIENSEELTSIAPVAGLKKLTVFTLSAEKVKDFSPLSGLTGLTKLQVASDAMGPDLKWMSGLTKINSLAVSGGPSLTSMEGLPSLPGLRSARISHGVFADLSPITALPGLTSLELTYCTMSDLSALTKLQNLKSLSFYGSQVKVFSALAGCPKLESFMYYAVKDADFNTLGKLTQVKELKGGLTRLDNISWVAGLPNLKKFDVFAEYVTDYSPLARSKVENFQIWSMKVPVNLKTLAGATSLKWLKLWSVKDVSGFEALGSLTGLEKLILNGVNEKQGPVDLSFMGSLRGIKELELSSFDGVKTSGMGSLTALTQLNCYKLNKNGSEPFDLSFLSKLTSLKNLRVSDCKVSHFEAVSGLGALSTVTLQKVDGLTSLDAFKKLPALKQFSVGRGEFKDADLTGFDSNVKVSQR